MFLQQKFPDLRYTYIIVITEIPPLIYNYMYIVHNNIVELSHVQKLYQNLTSLMHNRKGLYF